MKLLYFDDFRLGVLAGDSVVDVTELVSDIPHVERGDLINGLIARFEDYRGRLEDAAASGGGVPLAGVRIRPPVPRPTTIDCMAVNYMEDGTRDAPAQINAFHKSPGAVIGPEDTMILPDVPAAVFEGEAELAAIVGKRADNIGEAEAMGPRLRLDLLHRRLGPGPAAAREHLLPGQVAQDLRADRAVDRHQGRDRGSAEPPGEALEQRRADAGLPTPTTWRTRSRAASPGCRRSTR